MITGKKRILFLLFLTCSFDLAQSEQCIPKTEHFLNNSLVHFYPTKWMRLHLFLHFVENLNALTKIT